MGNILDSIRSLGDFGWVIALLLSCVATIGTLYKNIIDGKLDALQLDIDGKVGNLKLNADNLKEYVLGIESRGRDDKKEIKEDIEKLEKILIELRNSKYEEQQIMKQILSKVS